jgi:hypothetical protein
VFGAVVMWPRWQPLLWTSGPHAPQAETKDAPADPSNGALELDDAGEVRCVRGSLDLGNVPPDVLVNRAFTLRSSLSSELSGIRIVPSCGCARAHYDRTTIRPGEQVLLRFTLDTQGRRGAQKVNFYVRGDSASFAAVIPVRYCVEDSPEAALMTATPTAIRIREPWRPHRRFIVPVVLQPHRTVDVATIRVRAIHPSITTVMERGSGPGGEVRLTVHAEDLPPGEHGHSVGVAFTSGGHEYELPIPVHLSVVPRYDVVPAICVLGHVRRGADARTTLRVRTLDDSSSAPRIVTDGAVAHVATEQLSPREYVLHFKPVESAGRYLAGKIRLGGDLGEPPVVIPVFGTRVE